MIKGKRMIPRLLIFAVALALGIAFADLLPGLPQALQRELARITGEALAIVQDEPSTPRDEASSGEAFERGPHGGRILRDGKFALEITIFEEGVPPEFHVFPYFDGKRLSPAAVDLQIELGRLGGRVDKIPFKPRDDYLRGTATVVEPHSFDVRVRAEYGGATSKWDYASYEGRTQISAEAAKAAEVAIETAGPATIRDVIKLTGTVSLNADSVVRVGARFPGVVRVVHKEIGERVRAGDTLAVVESNESLRGYTIEAPIDGVVLARTVNVGHVATPDGAMFEIADLSNVWVQLHAFGSDVDRIKTGQPVTVEKVDGTAQAEGVVDFVRPHTEGASQAIAVRVVLDNQDGRWRPGTFVRGSVSVAEKRVPLAVKSSALQRFRDFTVVFAQFGDTYEVRMLELGDTDGAWTEVVGGIEPGQAYVANNSFLIKADIEKEGASHDH